MLLVEEVEEVELQHRRELVILKTVVTDRCSRFQAVRVAQGVGMGVRITHVELVEAVVVAEQAPLTPALTLAMVIARGR